MMHFVKLLFQISKHAIIFCISTSLLRYKILRHSDIKILNQMYHQEERILVNKIISVFWMVGWEELRRVLLLIFIKCIYNVNIFG